MSILKQTGLTSIGGVVAESDIMLRRFLRDGEFDRMKADFSGLCRRAARSNGDVEIAFRDGRFSIYYQGNSLATVVFRPDGQYYFDVHKKFFQATKLDRDFKYEGGQWDYIRIKGNAACMNQVLRNEYLEQLKTAISAHASGGELAFEQLLIADNQPAPEFVIVDRQVTDKHMRRRLDLLGLRRLESGKYRFVVLEVKLGCNGELSGKVGKQLEDYVTHIEREIDHYAECYTIAYRQKRELGLLGDAMPESVDIDRSDVEGLVVVGSYSHLARRQVADLKKEYPDIKVRIVDNGLIGEDGQFEKVI